MHHRLGIMIVSLALFVVSLACAAPTTAKTAPPAHTALQHITGTIHAGRATAVPLMLTSQQYRPASRGAVLLSLTLKRAKSRLDPGRIDVVGRRRAGSVTLLTRRDLGRRQDSYALARVKLDRRFEVRLHGERRTRGRFVLAVAFAGDVDGDRRVTRKDIRKVMRLIGATRTSGRYVAAADVNQDGRVTRADVRLAKRNRGARHVRGFPLNPLDRPLPPGSIELQGVTETGFNDVVSPVGFSLSGARYSLAPGDTRAWVNDVPVSVDQVSVSAKEVVLDHVLQDGLNSVRLTTVDDIGRPVYAQAQVWAGSSELAVRVVNPDGTEVQEDVELTVSLADDQSVRVTVPKQPWSGPVTLHNVPDRTVLAEAVAGDRVGSAGTTGSAGSVEVVVRGVGVPSSVDNNDFADGTTDGWDIGTAPVIVAPHIEEVGPGLGTPAQTGLRPVPRVDRAAVPRDPMRQSARRAEAPITDNDLSLGTSGEGPQSVSRTFQTDPDVSAVRLRYRFVTSEVPGGYYGTQFNDYYQVSLRSGTGGGNATESNSMNGLGLSAFDAGGSTAWREVTLPTDIDGDVIQVDLTVANVADNLLDSQVIVDFVEEVRVRVVPTLTWNNTQGGLDLRYTVQGGPLTDGRDITVSFATGPNYGDRTGATAFTQTVPSGTADGSYGPFHVPGAQLANDPPGATHVLAYSSPSAVGPLPDVALGLGPNANPAGINAAMTDVIKDGLRAAGQTSATVTSTARTPADQARAMFNNLTNPNHTIAQNTATQHGIYAPPGDAVINVFTAQTQGMTPAQIQQNRPQVEAAMEAEINNQGPSNVSRHVANPGSVVVDVGAGPFNAQNGPLFVGSVTPRLHNFIDERNTNGCYHLEL